MLDTIASRIGRPPAMMHKESVSPTPWKTNRNAGVATPPTLPETSTTAKGAASNCGRAGDPSGNEQEQQQQPTRRYTGGAYPVGCAPALATGAAANYRNTAERNGLCRIDEQLPLPLIPTASSSRKRQLLRGPNEQGKAPTSFKPTKKQIVLSFVANSKTPLAGLHLGDFFEFEAHGNCRAAPFFSRFYACGGGGKLSQISDFLALIGTPREMDVRKADDRPKTKETRNPPRVNIVRQSAKKAAKRAIESSAVGIRALDLIAVFLLTNFFA
ncbi:unnamed protein product [Caenorhabditis auriculariae]|uniref:Uncharacterized protein n=1 Tax=Caenorhabditis auriculariae TaxID=2777116 RepID=A0A8S1GP33_9PELO|nr:unnamed protein product [Caenorhabditis auriculariae]